ncbi:N-acetyltransferase GCN5 [Marinobacterium zhoushanense]|uniref:N-acetyltransferase GCN5 n=1 Tax=Marinobacterium zhoushanense TaxID=1679163 RepID=A0ABQ1JYD2_9GAMM|nr:GNAT family N-acetyltransferase [Marinobacterium zhoushanense]GGB79140.1 N-acetyltransferase GCN5 [Marinobacterium zhoushanense]
MKRDLEIRVMTPDEIDMMVEWAAQEGWNPGLNDAACYRLADPNGFLVGLYGGQPVATISVVRYGAEFGFLGFYMVKPEFRGRGFGLAIWQAGLAYLEGCTVGLDGVVAQQDNYRRSGFELAWRNIRFEGRGLGNQPVDADIVPLHSLSFDRLHAYDSAFFPTARDQFLRQWTTQPGHRAVAIVEAGKLVGYAVRRLCRQGYKIGPLYADRAELAERLFQHLAGSLGSADHIYLDVPEVNAEAVALAQRHGMSLSFETARMYKGPAPELPLDRLFGVTSFEIG